MNDFISKIEGLIAQIDNCSKNHDQDAEDSHDFNQLNFVTNIIDDLWVNIFCLCNVKTFISITHTCKHFHHLTNIHNSINKNYLGRLKQYWKNQCKVLWTYLNDEYKDVNTNKYDWYATYQELVIVISNLFAAQYLFKIERKIALDRKSGVNGQLVSYLDANKQQIEAKNYLNDIITAPHLPKMYNIKNTDENTNIKYEGIDLRELVTDKDIVALPTKLHDIEVQSFVFVISVKIAIEQIMEHDCINMFKLYTNQTCFKNGYSDEMIVDLFARHDIGWEKNFQGRSLTLFDCACSNGSIKIVKYLLQMMPSMKLCNTKHNAYMYTPLMFAVKYGRVKVVQLLAKKLGKNAINSRNNQHETALHVALMHRFDGQEVREMAKYLVDNGVDVNAANIRGKSALFISCARVSINIDICKLLVQHPGIKDNIDRCTCCGELALFALIGRLIHYPIGVSMSDFKQFFQSIIDHGIKTKNDRLKNIGEIRYKTGETLLMFVAKNDIVKCFVFN